jgi:hypothetical protein
MDWLGSDHVRTLTDARSNRRVVFSVHGACRGVIRRQSKFTVGVGVSRRRSEFRELTVESDKEEIGLCQEDLVCDLKSLQVLQYSDIGSV